mmetsp:Transcript_22129/g.61564  ORF Transcript_22129/g.61564 Transcript_22129/m.61564 type:complete len:360 (-) Transcript_22129:637-1716(-)
MHGGRHDEALGGTCIYHPLFIKGMPDLCSKMTRERLRSPSPTLPPSAVAAAVSSSSSAAAAIRSNKVHDDNCSSACSHHSIASNTSGARKQRPQTGSPGAKSTSPSTIETTISIIRENQPHPNHAAADSNRVQASVNKPSGAKRRMTPPNSFIDLRQLTSNMVTTPRLNALGQEQAHTSNERFAVATPQHTASAVIPSLSSDVRQLAPMAFPPAATSAAQLQAINALLGQAQPDAAAALARQVDDARVALIAQLIAQGVVPNPVTQQQQQIQSIQALLSPMVTPPTVAAAPPPAAPQPPMMAAQPPPQAAPPANTVILEAMNCLPDLRNHQATVSTMIAAIEQALVGLAQQQQQHQPPR